VEQTHLVFYSELTQTFVHYKVAGAACSAGVSTVERVTGIEPAWPAWKAGALPLSYTREATDRPAFGARWLASRLAVRDGA
jgi:hypothetical protein